MNWLKWTQILVFLHDISLDQAGYLIAPLAVYHDRDASSNFTFNSFGHHREQFMLFCFPQWWINALMLYPKLHSSIYKTQLTIVTIIVLCYKLGSWFLFVYNIE